MTGIMPSSTHATAYSGPTSVIPHHSAQPMHAYQYKNIAPLSTGMGSPSVTNPSHRNRFVHHDSPTSHLNQTATNSNSFGSPGPHSTAMNGTYSARASNSRGHHNPHAIPQQTNGIPSSNPSELMSMSMHTPASNYHYWPAAAVVANQSNPVSNSSGTNNAPSSGVSPYAHTNAMPGNPNAYVPHPTTPVSGHDFHLKHNGTASLKPTGMNRSSQSSKYNSSTSTSGSNRPLWKERPHVGRYSLIRTIGKGNFAKVKLAQHLTTGMQVAVKVIDKTLLNQSSMQKLFREVRVLKTLNHPNIIKLLEVIESERHLYLVMEYASGGEVFDYLVSHGKMKEADARIKFRQIVSAVQYCHQKMVVHRDLKAENLLLDSDLNIKIADFGFSNYFSTSQKLDTFCGSPPYAAPELFLGRKYEGPEVDVWSLGVILYTLVSGTLPFDGKNLKELRERVLRGTYRVPFYMTHECETLLKKMLVLNPAKRLPLAEVMRDPWLNQGFDAVLRPYNEPPADYCDPERIETMVRMGFKPNEIQEALTQQRFNNITATYILLGRYDPKVHGRLPGLANASHSMSRLSNKSDTYQGEFSLNGTTQPVPVASKSGGALHHTLRPASALPTTQHHFPNNRSSTQNRRTPDEGLFSRTAAAFTARTLQEQFAGEKESSSKVSTNKQSVSSVASTVTTTNSSSTDAATSKVTATITSSASHSGRPYPTVRRAATTYEPRTSIPTSATITNIMTNNGNAVTESRKSSSSSPPLPSQAPPPDHPPHVVALPSQQSSAITVHPPAVTTAHLVLTNGPSATPTRGLSPAANSNIQRPAPSSVRKNSTTAPLAKDEDEPFTPSESRNTISVRRTRQKPLPGTDSKSTFNGVADSSASSTSDDSDSASDIYDRELASGSSGGSVNSAAQMKKNRGNKPNGALESNVTSVVLAAAPAVNSPNTANSLQGRQSSGAAGFDSNAKMSNRDSDFARMPSVRRKSSIRANAEAAEPNSPKSSTLTARTTRPSSVDPQQQPTTTIGSPSPKPRVPSIGSSKMNREFMEPTREDTPGKEVLPQTKPRSLFRGPPNAADIISEANPFRLAADNTAQPTPPAVPPHCNRPSLISNPPTRGFSPPATNAISNAIRRPAAPPPPPLATNSVTNPPSRTSYAYHSLRLPSSTTTTTIAMGKEGISDLNSRLYTRPVDSTVNSRWSSSHSREDGMATPTPSGMSNQADIYTVPFNRNLPERSTIQHIPTGRARERLEGTSTGPRLVRHAGTHSIATQSIRIRPASPFRTDDSNLATPRANSPDDLSISSVASSASTLGQNDCVFERRRYEDSPPVEYSNRGNSAVGRQRNTLGSPVQGFTRNFSMRPPNSRDNQANGGFNNFFRTLTTRISRSKLFRRSTIMQANSNYNDQDLGHHDSRHSRLDPMLAPTMELDKVVVTRGSPSPDTSLKPSVNRIPRSRSGVASHRPVSQAAPRLSDTLDEDAHSSRKTERHQSPVDVEQSTIKRKTSNRSSSSRGNRSRSVQRPSLSKSDSTGDESALYATQQNARSKRGSNSDRRKRSPSPVSKAESETTKTFSGRNNRSMRYVLRPFARWPLEEVMVQVQQSLLKHNVDFEVVGEHKLQCVYGDPSHGCQVPTLQNSNGSPSPNSLLDPGLETGVVHWEMEIGKLAGVGMNGIRFKRIDGSMPAFKQIAKKLAADLNL